MKPLRRKSQSLLCDYDEPYRRLRTHLQYLTSGEESKSVLITSASKGEGKTTIAANLAFSLQQLKQKVLLIDCDFRKPYQSKISFFGEQKGLFHALRGGFPYDTVVKYLTGNLAFIPAGELYSNSTEILTSPELKTCLANARAAFDWIIVDSPAVLSYTDAQILATMVDRVILVIAEGKSDHVMLDRTCDLLCRVNANIVGAVFNKATGSI